MDDRERVEALEDAVRNAVAAHASQRSSTRPVAAPAAEGSRIAVILIGWALIGYIWLAQPAILFGPAVVAEVPAEEREARLRYAMYLHHHQLVAFTREHGRRPQSLNELDHRSAAGVRLEFDDSGSWILVGSDQEVQLRLPEAMSADSFLGSSLATLQGAR